jgi:L-alanine-DL-glutamate epimerase-like enolase superfamily enzyme
MSKSSDIKATSTSVYFLPVETRIPYRFGTEELKSVICVRACVQVENRSGDRAEGWGEAPLSAAWAWPSGLTFVDRQDAMMALCLELGKAWADFTVEGHPMEVGHAFLTNVLEDLLESFNENRPEHMPWLAALVCNSAFDLAVHDAYGQLLGRSIYDTYDAEHLNADLSHYLTPGANTDASFKGRYPADFLVAARPTTVPAWHAVGGGDLLSDSERTGSEPDDGYPVVLDEWIRRDGLNCLKIKLTGQEEGWDYDRIVNIGSIADEHDVDWLCTDFNCTVETPEYVNDILDRLLIDHPRTYQRILYVEQPFPYDLEKNPIDAHSVSARKPLYMDESAHDWRLLDIGRDRGWTGVALKACKTQTVAILSMCWARAHGMGLMVQDLTNPMLAQITHALLAAHTGTVMGLETNSMQFYPDASLAEAAVHPGIFKRNHGVLDVSTVSAPGFGYEIDRIGRQLPEPAVTFG